MCIYTQVVPKKLCHVVGLVHNMAQFFGTACSIYILKKTVLQSQSVLSNVIGREFSSGVLHFIDIQSIAVLQLLKTF